MKLQIKMLLVNKNAFGQCFCFWSGEVLSKLKCRGFRATSLSTHDFSTLYSTLPHNLIRFDKVDLQKSIKNYGSLYLTCNDKKAFSLPLTKVGIHLGHVRMCATPYPISWIIYILDLGPCYTDILLEFRWVQIALFP